MSHAIDRFLAKIVIDPSTNCWVWLATRTTAGYGLFYDRGAHRVLAHRWAWTQLHGPIPAELQIDHLCRNKACVYTRHLELVTPAENTRRIVGGNRGVARGKQQREKTRCPQGHTYDEDNTRIGRQGKNGKYQHRTCRVCDREKQRRYRERRRNS